MVFPGYARQSGPNPVNPQDLATKTYVDNWRGIPPPVTSGTTVQSYTDPTGEVWVALNGVSGGAWKRGRDALHAKWFRNAAMNLTNTLVAIPMDMAQQDAYAMWAAGNNAFLAPIPGLYVATLQVAVTATATGQMVAARLYGGSGGGLQAITQAYASATGTLTTICSQTLSLGAGSYMQPNGMLNVAGPLAMGVGIPGAGYWTWMTFDYLGTG
jgi:hypothetical protein